MELLFYWYRKICLIYRVFKYAGDEKYTKATCIDNYKKRVTVIKLILIVHLAIFSKLNLEKKESMIFSLISLDIDINNIHLFLTNDPQ